MANAGQGFPPIDLLNSASVKIDDITLTANIETPFTLENNLNQLFIKARSNNILKISFVAGDILLGKYWTVPMGCSETISDIDFNGKIIYIEAINAGVVEIMQLFT